MKRLIFPIIALIALFVAGCSEKFKIAAPYKNITVVYAFLDKADTAHYIRIQKAFLDQDKSAITMAKDADSSFNANINVRIERINFTTLAVVDTIHLVRVDLNLEGYPKQPGAFFDAPNYAYKFRNTLDPRYIYRLKIINFATGEIDSADAPIIEDTDPAKLYMDALDTTQHILLDFSSRASSAFYQFYGQSIPTPGFTYYHSQSNQNFNNPVYVQQVVIRFNWDDSDISTHAHTPHYFDYVASSKSKVTNGILDFQLFNNSVQSSLASLSGLGIAPPNQVRLMNRCDFTIYLSTYDFYAYQQSSLIQGTGLTGTEIQPMYTNIKGANVLGLYTSRGVRTGKITLTPATIDSLMSSPLYAQALVRGTVYH